MDYVKQLMGLAFLAWPLTLLILVGLAFLIVIPLAIRFAKRTGRSRWRWGIAGFLVVFLPIFWDWIPTVVTHKYYCSTEAGFWVYKTVDEWKDENPGVMETLTTQKVWLHDYRDGRDVVHINQRFDLVYEKKELPMHLWKWQRELVDTETKKVVARYVDFSTGNGKIGGEPELRFWLHKDFCSTGRDKAIEFGELSIQFKGVEE